MATMMIEAPVRPLIFNGYFILTPYGAEAIGEPPYEEWFDFTTGLFKIRRAIQLGIGDMMNYGEVVYGESYAQVSVATEIEPDQLMNYKWVSSRVPLKWRISFTTENLHLFSYTFCYHAARIENDEQRLALITAGVAEQWDSTQMKAAVDKINGGRSPDAHACLHRAILNLQAALKLNPEWESPLARIVRRLQTLNDER